VETATHDFFVELVVDGMCECVDVVEVGVPPSRGRRHAADEVARPALCTGRRTQNQEEPPLVNDELWEESMLFEQSKDQDIAKQEARC